MLDRVILIKNLSVFKDSLRNWELDHRADCVCVEKKFYNFYIAGEVILVLKIFVFLNTVKTGY